MSPKHRTAARLLDAARGNSLTASLRTALVPKISIRSLERHGLVGDHAVDALHVEEQRCSLV